MAKLSFKTWLSIVLVLISTVLVVVSAGVTLAKYAKLDTDDTPPAVPKSFYFESDLLALSQPSYSIGTTEIHLNIMNYADELRVSDVGIDYTVTLTERGEDEPIETQTVPKSDMPASTKTKLHHTFTGLEYGKTYIVTASATYPYTKTLSAAFTVYDEQNSASYRVYTDTEYGDNIVYLEVKTNDVKNAINVYWQNGYVPDNSYVPMVQAAGTVATDVELGAYGTHVIRFFKSNLNASLDTSLFFIDMVIDNADTDNGIGSDPMDSEGNWN